MNVSILPRIPKLPMISVNFEPVTVPCHCETNYTKAATLSKAPVRELVVVQIAVGFQPPTGQTFALKIKMILKS